jgi:hypothetical protein
MFVDKNVLRIVGLQNNEDSNRKRISQAMWEL